jgi:hypothetical protein
LLDVFGDSVGQGAFHVVPDKFIGVEFRSIGREKMNMESRMLPKEVCDTLCSVRESTVPKKNHVPSEMAKQVPQELDDLRCANVLVRVKSTVQPQAILSGRDGKDRDS